MTTIAAGLGNQRKMNRAKAPS